MEKQLLIDARNEITALRRTNEILAAKVEMIDLFALVLHTEPARQSRGACPDIAWQLSQAVEKYDQAQSAKTPPPPIAPDPNPRH